LNPLEIILILAVALIVIGPERMPEVMRAVGKVLRELRLASNTVLHELTDGLDEQPPKARPSAPTNGQPPTPPSEKT
jgi:TatA/E family protein of Tat protein translocase